MGGSKKTKGSVSRETFPDWRSRPLDELLAQAAQTLGVSLSPPQTARLLDFLSELLRWNRKTNLVAPAPPAEMILLHLVDCLVPLADFPPDPALSVLDIGSGAGLPGLVFKILRPAWPITLAERNPKKTTFLKSSALHLSLAGLRVRSGPLAEPEPAETGQFELITARALGPLPDFLRLARPFLAAEGILAAYKGPQAYREIEASTETLRDLGLKLARRRDYTLPFLNRRRVLLYFKEKERKS